MDRALVTATAAAVVSHSYMMTVTGIVTATAVVTVTAISCF